ncbi:MAG TPA: YdcF family protein [Elusimicrobiales bacterium]|nr:YdcF family protein [Elusimicrobiales bacterium]
MFLIKKIITCFVLPPGIFIVAAAGLAVYLRRGHKKGAMLCAALAACMWVASTKVFSDALLRPLEYAYAAPVAPAGEVIIALGGGAYAAPEFFSAGERLQPGSLERMSAAALLHKATGLPVMVSAGAVFSSIAEADAAAAYLQERGVPAGAIIKERESRDTYENAVNTRKLCLERGYKKIILLTSASHMPRAVYSFKKAGFTDILPFPVTRTAVKEEKLYFRDFLPGGFNASARALNEYIGLLFYRLAY